ncbi:MAG: hypothetical protein WCX84_09365 [Syntrophales bacterium]|jgi:hypothetical protein|nr:hypothetical protein [Syntrophales bacterium]
MMLYEGCGSDFGEAGTIRMVDGKVVYNLTPALKEAFGTPRGEPENFMGHPAGRFALPSTVLLEMEPGAHF